MAGDPGVRARFQREADTAARLAHPNIVSVYARGEFGGRLWIAMEYVDGTDVAALLDSAALAPDYAVWVLTEAARAFDHAHQHNILHRDVKPANILLSRGPQQRVLLADSVSPRRWMNRWASPAPGRYTRVSGTRLRSSSIRPPVWTGAPMSTPSVGRFITRSPVHRHFRRPPLPIRCTVTSTFPFRLRVVGTQVLRPLSTQWWHGQWPRTHRSGSVVVASSLLLQPMHCAGNGPRSRSPPKHGSVQVTPPRRRGVVIAAVVAPVVLVGSIGAAVVAAMNIGADARHVVSEQDSRQALEVRACEIGTILMTLEPGKSDEAMQAMIDNSTKSFGASVERSRTELAELVQQSQATSRVSDAECFFKSGDEHTAEILFTGNRTITNASTPKPKKIDITMTMTLEKVDGRWLCSNTVEPES